MKNPVVLALALLLVFAVTGVAALEPLPETLRIEPGYYPDQFQVLGNNQYYTATFDGEGEATVAAKIIVQNLQQTNLTELTLEIPGTVRIISAVQEHQEYIERCIQYDRQCTEYSDETDCIERDRSGECVRFERRCLEWKETCVQYTKQLSWPPKYYSLDIAEEQLSQSKSVTISLPRPVGEQEQATILLYYKATGYASKSLGVFDFTFETIKMPLDVQNVRVAIDVHPDLHLKGGEGSVDYQPPVAAFGSLAKEAVAVESQALSDFSQRLTYYGGYVKTAQGLDPLESFTVEGKYSETKALLHLGPIVTGVLGAMAVLALLVFGIVKLAGYLKTTKKHNAGWVAALTGLVSALLIAGIFIGGMFLLDFIDSYFYYQMGEFVMLFFGLLWVLVLLALLVVPSIFVGLRYGAVYGVVCIGVTLGALLILGILLILVLALTNVPYYY